ncbi:uncharacterized protein LOC126839681 [Adelges cooleyi]|uniref:uncharacterized protein LOC126839681 n=1 Tax=Adelges cooleyi TaxID=133065 RepID=UPI00218097C8|nr:uncharacterized protein LOC126839681 [Adelges cooleyi]
MMNIKIILLLSLAAYALCGDNQLPENASGSGSGSPRQNTFQEIFQNADAKAMKDAFDEALSFLKINKIENNPSEISLNNFLVFAIQADKDVYKIMKGLWEKNQKPEEYYNSLNFEKFEEVVKHICEVKKITVEEFAGDRKKEGDGRRNILSMRLNQWSDGD